MSAEPVGPAAASRLSHGLWLVAGAPPALPWTSGTDFATWVATLAPPDGDAAAYGSLLADLTIRDLVDVYEHLVRAASVLQWLQGKVAAEALDRVESQAAEADEHAEVDVDLARSSIVAELAIATGTSSEAVLTTARDARTLAAALPGVDDLAARGDLDRAKTRMVLDAVERLTAPAQQPPPETTTQATTQEEADRAHAALVARRWARLDDVLQGRDSGGLGGISDLGTRPRSSLRRLLSHRLACLAPRSAPARDEVRPGLRLRPLPGDEGWSELTITGRTADLALFVRALRQAADTLDTPTTVGDDTSKADAPSDVGATARRRPRAGASQVATLVSWALHALADRPLNAQGRPLPGLDLVVLAPLSTLESRRGSADTAQRPGWMPGHGPIPGELVHDLLQHATIRLGVTDDTTGRLLALGASTTRLAEAPGYVPPVWLRRFVTVDRPQCTFTGCSRAALACDLDHSVPWPDGHTDCLTLHPLCRHHHRLKTLCGWRSTLDPWTGDVLWTTPTGRRVVSDGDAASLLDLRGGAQTQSTQTPPAQTPATPSSSRAAPRGDAVVDPPPF